VYVRVPSSGVPIMAISILVLLCALLFPLFRPEEFCAMMQIGTNGTTCPQQLDCKQLTVDVPSSSNRLDVSAPPPPPEFPRCVLELHWDDLSKDAKFLPFLKSRLTSLLASERLLQPNRCRFNTIEVREGYVSTIDDPTPPHRVVLFLQKHMSDRAEGVWGLRQFNALQEAQR
jgi:hypothetical protein